jgi:hypothetical protein
MRDVQHPDTGGVGHVIRVEEDDGLEWSGQH